MHFRSDVHIPQLDGIRGIAIAMVLVWHYGNLVVQTPNTQWFLHSIQFTWSGVDLFFVLSGFLIGGILIDARDKPDYWQSFYRKRAFRILPLYLLVLFSFLVFREIRAGRLAWLFDQEFSLWTYATFTQNITAAWLNSFGPHWMGPTWSLAVEEQFYLLFPLVVRFVRPRLFPLAVVSMIVFTPILRIALWHWFSKDFIMATYTLTPCRADALLLGVLCAWFVRNRSIDPRYLKIALAILAVGTAILLVKSPLYYQRLTVFIGFTWIAMFYSVLLIAAIFSDGALYRITTWSPLTWLGKHAYGLYLYHIIVVGVVFDIFIGGSPKVDNLNELSATLLSVIVTFAAASLSLKYFEAPLIRLGKTPLKVVTA